MAYRCVATSVAGFVQQLAVAYVAHGYWFYVTGRVPEGKDPADVDRKLIARYEIGFRGLCRKQSSTSSPRLTPPRERACTGLHPHATIPGHPPAPRSRRWFRPGH